MRAVQRRFEPFSDYELEVYVAGAADAETARRIEQAAITDAELATHLRERDAERRAFYMLQPRFVPDTGEAPVRAGSRRRLWVALSTLGLAAAAVVMTVLPKDADVVWQPQADVRMKGGLGVRVVVERDGARFDAGPNTRLAPGDRLQLV